MPGDQATIRVPDTKTSAPPQSGAGMSDPAARSRLGRGLGTLGFEIVDIAALLKAVDLRARDVRGGLSDLRDSAASIDAALATATGAMARVEQAASSSVAQAGDSLSGIREAATQSRRVAEWVGALSTRIADMEARLEAVERSTARIGDIAAEVGILAINARIVAARAGDHGRGFAVVAEAISDLAAQTAEVTRGISGEVAGFGTVVTGIRDESAAVRTDAQGVLETGRTTDAALTAIGGHLETTQDGVTQMASDLQALARANEAFRPVLDRLAAGVDETAQRLGRGHTRVEALIDLAEDLVQANAAMGGASEDGPMIDRVRDAAARIAAAFEQALQSGALAQADLFDTDYRPVEGSDPPQVLTRFTRFTDRVLPPIQDPVLRTDGRIVFCAAVDRNGYLPTHNAEFSQPQGSDPVWNAAHCRNRRIFDDRVGLKAGRSTAPFLLQVYRRDMGGGEITLMKDLSAPITVRGRHWGALRLAYRPD